VASGKAIIEDLRGFKKSNYGGVMWWCTLLSGVAKGKTIMEN